MSFNEPLGASQMRAKMIRSRKPSKLDKPHIERRVKEENIVHQLINTPRSHWSREMWKEYNDRIARNS